MTDTLFWILVFMQGFCAGNIFQIWVRRWAKEEKRKDPADE